MAEILQQLRQFIDIVQLQAMNEKDLLSIPTGAFCFGQDRVISHLEFSGNLWIWLARKVLVF